MATTTVCARGGRTDRCPGILRLHEAGDGALARVRLPGGRASAEALDALAAGARLGNGIAELTSRASVQLRGLVAGGSDALVAVLRGGGLMPSAAHDRVRNVLASPFGGRVGVGELGSDDVVAALDAGLCADAGLAELPGRFLFAVDCGDGFVDRGATDVGLVAGLGAWRLWLAGRATALVADDAAGAAELALAAARAFLAVRGAGGGDADAGAGSGGTAGGARAGDDAAAGAWHVRDLPDGAARLANALGTTLGDGTPATAPVAPALGPRHQRDGRVALTALPRLGRLDAGQLDALAALVRAAGDGADVRLSGERTITVVDIEPARAGALADGLAAIGLLVAEDAGWEGLSACSGAGACRRARIDVRAAAEVRATQRGPGAPREHWCACDRGCGMPRGQGVVQVAAAGDDERVGGDHPALDAEAAVHVTVAGATTTARSAADAIALLATPAKVEVPA